MLFLNLFLAGASAAMIGSRSDTSDFKAVHVPGVASRGKQVVPGNYQSYSIEFNYMLDYAGNNSNPNAFSSQLLRNLADVSGAYPIIRAGGTTQNRATFVANQTEALIEKFSSSNADQPSSLSIGPTWIQSFQQFPNGTQYIYGLNFGDGESGLNQTVLEAANAFNGISDTLYAFEIGNEVDGFPCGSRRPCNWTIISYVEQMLQYAAAIGNESIGLEIDRKVEPLFQGCAFEAPRYVGYNETPYWNVENALKYGISSTGRTKTVADHDYMGSACSDTTQVATIAFNLLNHTHTTSIAYWHEYLGNKTAEYHIPYVLGETNSVSCQGLAGVSDVFAAALWSIDYILYMASLKVTRVYFHQGTPYRYSAWQPVATNTSEAHVKPLYYGNLFTSRAFAGGYKQVMVLANETSFTAYGIYDATRNGALESVVLLNLEVFNSTQSAADRGVTQVHLSGNYPNAKVQRLTSPGVEIADNITFAGQSVSDENGTILGTRVTESVRNNTVTVAAGEAVLVTF